MIYCYEGNGFLEVLDQMHVCICPCMHLLKFYHQILLYLLQRNDPAYGDIEADRKGETSETLAQALQEKVLCTFVFSVIYPLCVCTFFFFKFLLSKTRMLSFILLLLKLWSLCQVAALLLLSQQEERHLLERNVNAALQKKIEELQRNLFQVISWFDYTQLLEILQQHLMT